MSRNADGTWNVRSQLILKPGVKRKSENFAHPNISQTKVENFFCHIQHEDLREPEQSVKKVEINVLRKIFFGL